MGTEVRLSSPPLSHTYKAADLNKAGSAHGGLNGFRHRAAGVERALIPLRGCLRVHGQDVGIDSHDALHKNALQEIDAILI